MPDPPAYSSPLTYDSSKIPEKKMEIFNSDWYYKRYLQDDEWSGSASLHYKTWGVQGMLAPSHWCDHAGFLVIIRERGLNAVLETPIHRIRSQKCLPGLINITAEILYRSGCIKVEHISLKELLAINPNAVEFDKKFIACILGAEISKRIEFVSCISDLLHFSKVIEEPPKWFQPEDFAASNPDIPTMDNASLFFRYINYFPEQRPISHFCPVLPSKITDFLYLSHDKAFSRSLKISRKPLINRDRNATAQGLNISLLFGCVIYNNSSHEVSRCLMSIDQSIRNANRHGHKIASSALAIRINSPEIQATLNIIEKIRSLFGSINELHISFDGRNIGFGAGHNLIVKEFSSRKQDEIYVGINPDGCLHPYAVSSFLNIGLSLGFHSGIYEFIHLPKPHPKSFCPETLEATWASGACFAVSTSNYTTLGGFDENLFLYCEDVDFSIRARLNGLKIFTMPSAKFWHDITSRPSSGRALVMRISALYIAKKYRSNRYYIEIFNELKKIDTIQLAPKKADKLDVMSQSLPPELADEFFGYDLTFSRSRSI